MSVDENLSSVGTIGKKCVKPHSHQGIGSHCVIIGKGQKRDEVSKRIDSPKRLALNTNNAFFALLAAEVPTPF